MVYAMISNNNLARCQGVHLNRNQTRHKKRRVERNNLYQVEETPVSLRVVNGVAHVRESVLPSQGQVYMQGPTPEEKGKETKSRNRQVTVRQATIYN